MSEASERSINRVVQALARNRDGLDRHALGRELDLSRPTVTAAVSTLSDEEWVYEVESTSGEPTGPGPASKVLRLTGEAGWVGAIHIGHKTLRAGVASSELERRDQEPGAMVRSRMPEESSSYPVLDDGLKTLRAGVELLKKSMSAEGVTVDHLRGICVGIPAPIGYSDTILVPSMLPNWGQGSLRDPVERSIREVLGERQDGRTVPVFFENEAAADSRGILEMGWVDPLDEERPEGAEDRSRDFLYVKVSSGVRAGLVLGGRVLSGARGMTGEIGHLPLRGPGPQLGQSPSYQGRGTLDSEVSVDSIIRRIAETDSSVRECVAEGDSIVDEAVGLDELVQRVQPSEVIDRAVEEPAKYPSYRGIVVKAAATLGDAIADTVSLLDLDRVVLGGVFAKAEPIVIKPIQQALNANLRPPIEAKVVALDLDQRREAGLLGELAVALEKTEPLPFTRG